MYIASIDCEMTGLNPEQDQILSIGIVVEDTNNVVPIEECPQVHIIIPRESISGNVFALDMNRDLISDINDYNCLEDRKEEAGISYQGKGVFVREGVVSVFIYNWLLKNGFDSDSKDDRIHLNVLGKNFSSFDKIYLEKLPNWNTLIRVRQRVLDPAILAVKWSEDESLPNLKTCMDRAGLDPNKVVTHNALEDAKDTLLTLRGLTNDYLKYN